MLRIATGRLSDRTGRHWAISITGYAISVVSVPLLALRAASVVLTVEPDDRASREQRGASAVRVEAAASSSWHAHRSRLKSGRGVAAPWRQRDCLQATRERFRSSAAWERPSVNRHTDRGGRRIQVQVAVEGSRSAGDLIRLLLEEFDAARVSFDAEQGKVRIESDGNADRALVSALGVIEEWLTTCERQPAAVDVDGRSYTLYPSESFGGVR